MRSRWKSIPTLYPTEIVISIASSSSQQSMDGFVWSMDVTFYSIDVFIDEYCRWLLLNADIFGWWIGYCCDRAPDVFDCCSESLAIWIFGFREIIRITKGQRIDQLSPSHSTASCILCRQFKIFSWINVEISNVMTCHYLQIENIDKYGQTN